MLTPRVDLVEIWACNQLATVDRAEYARPMAAGHRPLWTSLVPRPHCEKVGSNSGNETSWPRVHGTPWPYGGFRLSLQQLFFCCGTKISTAHYYFYRTRTKWRKATPWQPVFSNPPGISPAHFSILNDNGIL